MEFLRQNTGRIEVARDGKLQRIYFGIGPVCYYVSVKTRRNLMLTMDRES